jgi:hypothetical protein
MRARIYFVLSALLLSLLSPLFISHAEAAVDSGVGVVTSGLKMYFDPANPSSSISSTVIKDLSGNGYNGTLTKTGSWPDVQTGQGRYLGFDGAGGYVDLPDITSPSNWSGLTFTFYANFGGGAGTFERIFDFGNGPNANNIIVGREGVSGNIFVEIYRDGGSGGYCRSTANSIGVGTWDYWAITMNGSNCYIYKNNVQNATQAYTYLPWARTLANNYIGKSNWADAAFEGGISDLAIYDRVLSSTELTQNYNAGIDITAPSITDTYLSSPENQLNISTLSAGAGTIFSIRSGYDTAKLSLSSSGDFAFQSNPNYEANDSYYNNFQYSVNARAMDPNGNYTDFYLQVSVTNVSESSALSIPTLSATPYKGVSVTITVTPSGDGTSIPGKITYLYAGKRIKNCYKKSYSGAGNATCSWKPPMQGIREISVTFTPTNTNYSASTAKKSFQVFKRTTNR